MRLSKQTKIQRDAGNCIHTYTHSFTDPLSVKTGLHIELMMEAGLQYAMKSMQYDITVVEINKNTKLYVGLTIE
jgi:hypothetical protein